MGAGNSRPKQKESIKSPRPVQEKREPEKQKFDSRSIQRDREKNEIKRTNGHIHDNKSVEIDKGKNNDIENEKIINNERQNEKWTNKEIERKNKERKSSWNDEDDDDNLDLDSAWKSNETKSKTKNYSNNEKLDKDVDEELKFNEFNKKRTMEIERLERAKKEHYPESYAEKNLRQQYTTELLRQKTMHRDPDEWKTTEDEDLEESFDVSKFQRVNQAKSQPKKDIFGDEDTDYSEYNRDSYYGQPKPSHRKSIPKYDISEEELIADIEKEMIF